MLGRAAAKICAQANLLQARNGYLAAHAHRLMSDHGITLKAGQVSNFTGLLQISLWPLRGNAVTR
jgi:hypothetical protein